MRPSTISLLLIVASVLFLALGVYHLIPGPPKLLTSDAPNGVHIKHAVAFFAVAIVSFVGSRFVRNAAQG